MKKGIKVLSCGLIAIFGAAGIVAFRASNHLFASNGRQSLLPAAFQRLNPGMTESDVIAAVGMPKSRSVNGKYAHKSPAEWTRIQVEADTDENSSADSSPTDLKATRLELELEHRIKDIWQYQPTPHVYVVARFDDQARLIRLDSGIVAQAPTSRH